jgi:hypothetical protein
VDHKRAESGDESAVVVLPAGGVAGAAVLPLDPDDPAQAAADRGDSDE